VREVATYFRIWPAEAGVREERLPDPGLIAERMVDELAAECRG